MEKSVVIIKPDAVNAKKIGEIINMYEKNGLRIVDMYMTKADTDILEKHYEEHEKRDFYNPLLKFMSSGPICVLLMQGENAVEVIREINGKTDPSKARPGTIRYLYGKNVTKNAVHGSESLQAAKEEIRLWFDI
ncbi:MAG: nucleoside-diphosphate kinase [Bacillota bacterium]